MNKFKKLFAVSAATALFATQTLTGVVYAYPISEELREAISYMISKGYTSAKTVETFDHARSITRAEAAKFFSKVALDMNKQKDTTKECKFEDVNEKTPIADDVRQAIKDACQLGLMRGRDGKFMPMDPLTKDQAITIIVRMLYGDQGSLDKNFEKAQKEGITKEKNLSDTFRPVTRGEIALMLYRTVEDGDDVTEMLNDLLNNNQNNQNNNQNNQNNENNQQSNQTTTDVLEVSLNPSSPKDGTSIPSNGVVRFATFDLTAGSKDVKISSITIERNGLFNIDSNSKAYFEKNGYRVSSRVSFSSDGKAIISFAPEFVVKANTTEKLDLVIELNGSAGVSYKFKIAEVAASSEVKLNNAVTPSLLSTDYKVAEFAIAVAGAGATYNVEGDISYEIGAFKVTNNKPSGVSETKDIVLKNVTLYQNESSDLTNLKDYVLERDGKVVANKYEINGRYITFYDINDLIRDGQTVTYYVKAKVAKVERKEDKYQLGIRRPSDIILEEKNSGARAKNNQNNFPSTSSYHTYTIKGADVVFSRNKEYPLSATVAKGTQQVILAAGYIEVKEGVLLEDPKVILNIKNGSGKSYNQIADNIYFKVGNNVLSYTMPSSTITGNDVSLTGTFDGSFTVNGKVEVLVYANLKTNAPNVILKLEDIKLDTFTRAEYINNGEKVESYVGTIPGRTITISETKASVVRTDTIGDTKIVSGKKGVTALEASLSVVEGNKIRVSKITFNFTGNDSSVTGFKNNSFAKLYINNNAVRTKKIDSTSVDFDGFTVEVDDKNPATIKLEVDFTDAFNTGSFQAILSGIAAVDVVTSNEVNINANIRGPKYTISEPKITLTKITTEDYTRLVAGGTKNITLLEFDILAEYDDVSLKDIYFSGTNLTGITNVRLIADTKVRTATYTTGDEIRFENIQDGYFVIPMGNKVRFKVVADALTELGLLKGVEINLNKDKGLTLRQSNGVEKTYTGYLLTGSRVDIADNIAKITKVAERNKNIATEAIRFKISAEGKDKVTLKKLEVAYALVEYTGSVNQPKIRVRDQNGNIVGSGDIQFLTSHTISISLENYNQISRNESREFYLEFDVIERNRDASWRVEIRDVEVQVSENSNDKINLKDYPRNTDQLPLVTSR